MQTTDMKNQSRTPGNQRREYRVELYTMSETESESENHFSQYFEHGNGD